MEQRAGRLILRCGEGSDARHRRCPISPRGLITLRCVDEGRSPSGFKETVCVSCILPHAAKEWVEMHDPVVYALDRRMPWGRSCLCILYASASAVVSAPPEAKARVLLGKWKPPDPPEGKRADEWHGMKARRSRPLVAVFCAGCRAGRCAGSVPQEGDVVWSTLASIACALPGGVASGASSYRWIGGMQRCAHG